MLLRPNTCETTSVTNLFTNIAHSGRPCAGDRLRPHGGLLREDFAASRLIVNAPHLGCALLSGPCGIAWLRLASVYGARGVPGQRIDVGAATSQRLSGCGESSRAQILRLRPLDRRRSKGCCPRPAVPCGCNSCRTHRPESRVHLVRRTDTRPARRLPGGTTRSEQNGFTVQPVRSEQVAVEAVVRD